MTDNIRHLRSAVDATPTDWQLRLIYADALEDATGEANTNSEGRQLLVLARGQRWQARFQEYPWSLQHGQSILANRVVGQILEPLIDNIWRDQYDGEPAYSYSFDRPSLASPILDECLAFALDHIAHSGEWIRGLSACKWRVRRSENKVLEIETIEMAVKYRDPYSNVYCIEFAIQPIELIDSFEGCIGQHSIESAWHCLSRDLYRRAGVTHMDPTPFHGIYLALEYLRAEHVVTGLEKTLRMPELPGLSVPPLWPSEMIIQ